MRRAELRPLTALRFVAAAAIVVFHMGGPLSLPLPPTWPLAHAVPFFFVLSGFILTYNHKGMGAEERRTYFISRFARIWPLHIAMLAMGWVLLSPQYSHYLNAQNGPLILLTNILLVHDWIPNFKFALYFNAVSWSISAEIFFYLVFPAVVGSCRKIISLLVLVCLLNSVLFYVSRDIVRTPGPVFDTSPWLVYPHMHPLALLPLFLLGMISAAAFERWRHMSLSTTQATIFEILALASIPWWLGYGFVHFWPAGLGTGGLTFYIYNSFAVLACPIILVFAYGRGIISRLLSMRLPNLLGKISFAMYLSHQILIVKSTSLIGSVSLPLLVLGDLAAILLCSYALYIWLEQPVMNYVIGRWGHQKRSVIGQGNTSTEPTDASLPYPSNRPTILASSPDMSGAIIRHDMSATGFLHSITSPALSERISELVRERPDVEALSYLVGPEKMTVWAHTIGATLDEGLRAAVPPIPPLALRRIVAAPSEAVFLWTGLADACIFVSFLEKHLSRDAIDILDFGSGCGRITRFLAQCPRYSVSACDANPELANWCKANLPLARAFHSSFSPPLEKDQSSLDVVLCMSVFTHLDEQTAKSWFIEIHRVLRPGGLLLLTTHGYAALKTIASSALHQSMFQSTADSALAMTDTLEERGFIFLPYTQATLEMANVGGTYGNSFVHERHFRSGWVDGFTVVEFAAAALRGWQDVTVLRKL